MGNSIVRAGPPPKPRASGPTPPRASSPRTAARSCPAPARSAWSRTAAWCRSATTRIPRSRRARSGRSTASATAFPATWRRSKRTARSRCSAADRTASTAAARRSSPRRSRRRSSSSPAVEDALVFGVPDERFGQRVVGVVALTDGADISEDDVIAGCRAQLAAFKAPVRLRSSPTCRARRTARPTTAPPRRWPAARPPRSHNCPPLGRIGASESWRPAGQRTRSRRGGCRILHRSRREPSASRRADFSPSP